MSKPDQIEITLTRLDSVLVESKSCWSSIRQLLCTLPWTIIIISLIQIVVQYALRQEVIREDNYQESVSVYYLALKRGFQGQDEVQGNDAFHYQLLKVR